jgi:hypothetical protein
MRRYSLQQDGVGDSEPIHCPPMCVSVLQLCHVKVLMGGVSCKTCYSCEHHES